MSDLKITLIQSDLAWENPKQNRENFSKKIDSINEPADLVILPEMFTTGFSMKSKELAETMDGVSVEWMKKKAEERKCVITGSLIIRENNNFYNRLIWAKHDGSIEIYDKKHLFRFANEQDYYTPGNKKLMIEIKGWRVSPLICYDLRFPVWSRNRNDCDLLIYIANWPEVRKDIWRLLLRARALENQVFVAGVNRVGSDGNNQPYTGDTALISPKGIELSNIKPGEEKVETISISMIELVDFREKYPVWMDADNFELIQ
ncbi:MAG: amidohydrolase [Bacteroidetes bacterium]|nr:amidohydrolase [Bacteroidota bacterium]